MKRLSTLSQTVGNRLKSHGHSVAVAESSTGGLVSAALLAVPGASSYFLGGGVIYTEAARTGLLGLGKAELGETRSSTEAYALLLARTMRERLGATWGVAESGAAGPTGNRYGDPPGHSCIAVAGPEERVMTLETGEADREANMWAFAQAALEMLATALKRCG